MNVVILMHEGDDAFGLFRMLFQIFFDLCTTRGIAIKSPIGVGKKVYFIYRLMWLDHFTLLSFTFVFPE